MMYNETISNGTSHIPPNGIGALTFTPMFSPSVIFACLFGILFLTHLILAVRHWRYYGYAIGMLSGLLLEMLGYIAKVQLSKNRMNKNAYIMYLIGLTLGPTFLSSSLYLGISLLQKRHGDARFKHIPPKWFATLFILGDFMCLCFIGCGGSLAAIYAWNPIGVDLMIAGLGCQVLFTAIFCIVLAIVYQRVLRSRGGQQMRLYMRGAALAAACLFIRSCWRVAELSEGFNGPLAAKEGIFIALDSIPIVIMSVILTLLEPGFWFRIKHDGKC